MVTIRTRMMARTMMRNRGNPRKTKRKHLFVVLMMIVLLDHYCVHHVCRRVESLSLRPLILGGVRCHQQEHQMQQWCPPTTTTNPRRCLFKVPTVAVGAVDCATTATMRFRPTPRWMGGTNNDSNNNNPGMEEAFRELEALTSLDDPEDYVPAPQRIAKPNDILRSSTSRSISTESDNNTDINSEGLLLQLDEYKPSSMEQDFAVYKSMAEEIEQDEQAIAYAEVLTELGDSALQGKSDDTYSQVLMDLGGSPSTAAAAAAAKPSSDESASADESFIVSSSTSTEQFMNEALKEAMNEVKVNNPRILSDSGGSDNVLDNKEIMREIEEIFGEGNKKLLASLEEIRMEQKALVAASQKVKSTDSNGRGGRSSGDGDDNKNDTVGRFANAERGMELMLDCVREEKVQVERAMADLQSANDKLDQSLVSRLQKGGLPKQASFVGFLLFAVRSLSDSVTLLVSGDESYLAAALIQGIVAFVCAAVFFLI